MGKNGKHISARIQRLYLPINGKQRFCSNMARLVGQRFNLVPSPHCQTLQVKAIKIITLKRDIFSCVSRKHLELSPQRWLFCKFLKGFFVKCYPVLWQSPPCVRNWQYWWPASVYKALQPICGSPKYVLSAMRNHVEGGWATSTQKWGAPHLRKKINLQISFFGLKWILWNNAVAQVSCSTIPPPLLGHLYSSERFWSHRLVISGTKSSCRPVISGERQGSYRVQFNIFISKVDDI